MSNNKQNFNNIIALVPQVLRFGYKIFQAWRSNGIDAAEARDLVEELFTILIFVLEEFELKLEVDADDAPEEPEDDAEGLSEEEEWDNLAKQAEATQRAFDKQNRKAI